MRYSGPGRGFYAALRQHLPPASLNLLLINVGIFLLCVLIPPLGSALLKWGTAWPAGVLHGQVWRLVTYMFLHAGGGHIFFNMLTFYFFAPRLEHQMGTRRFVIFYFVCGLGAAFLHLVVSLIAGRADELMIGASGALYGVLCANAVFFPNSIVYIQFLFPIKMKYLVWIFGVMAFLGSVGGAKSGISHITHLGGLLTALIWLYGPRWWNRFGGPGGRGGGRRRRGVGGHVEDLYDDPHWRLDQ